MAYVVMVYIVTAPSALVAQRQRHGSYVPMHSYGLRSYGLYSHGTVGTGGAAAASRFLGATLHMLAMNKCRPQLLYRP